MVVEVLSRNNRCLLMKKSNFANAKVKLGNCDLILNKSGSRGGAVDCWFKRPGFINLISHG